MGLHPEHDGEDLERRKGKGQHRRVAANDRWQHCHEDVPGVLAMLVANARNTWDVCKKKRGKSDTTSNEPRFARSGKMVWNCKDGEKRKNQVRMIVVVFLGAFRTDSTVVCSRWVRAMLGQSFLI